MVKQCNVVNAFGEFEFKNKKVKKTQIDFNSPFNLFKKIYSKYSRCFLLESMESDSGLARYSVLGFKPAATLKAQNGILEIKKEDEKEEIETPNPFNEIKSLIGNGSNEKGFRGGLVGYVSYESVRYFEPIPCNWGKRQILNLGSSWTL